MSRFHNLDARISEALAGEADQGGVPEKIEEPTPDEPENEPAPEPETPPEKEQAMPDDTPVEQTDAYKAGFAAATDRMNSVFASEHFAGREAHAARLLGTTLGSDEIAAQLEHFPKREELSAEAAAAATEEGGRAEMREAMANAGNADLGADQNSDAHTGRAAADSVWERANAKVEAQRKQKEA